MTRRTVDTSSEATRSAPSISERAAALLERWDAAEIRIHHADGETSRSVAAHAFIFPSRTSRGVLVWRLPIPPTDPYPMPLGHVMEGSLRRVDDDCVFFHVPLLNADMLVFAAGPLPELNAWRRRLGVKGLRRSREAERQEGLSMLPPWALRAYRRARASDSE